jgi:hypothetical protein
MEKAMDDREELARRIEHEIRAIGGSWLAESIPAIANAAVKAVLAAGYHRGPKLPEEGMEEWLAIVERLNAAARDAAADDPESEHAPTIAVLRALRGDRA